MSTVIATTHLERPNRSLDKVPGDSGLPLFGHTLDFLRNARSLVDQQRQRYGPVFALRIFGYPTVVVGDPEAAKAVLLDREQVFSSRLGWHTSIGELFSRGLMLRDFEEHRLHRRIFQSAFRSEAMRQYAAMMNPSIERGISDWHEVRDFRFYPAIKKLTLDIAVEVFLGIPLGAEAERLNRAFTDSVAASIALIKREIPGLAFRRGMNGRRHLEAYFAGLLPERRARPGSDMFSQLCEARGDEGERFSDRDVIDHMIFLLMAAHDTTTSSLTTLFWALASYPEWQERLRAEVAELDSPHLDWDDRGRLEQTEWALKEALRLFPPVPFVARRTLRDCELAGLRIPANTGLSASSLVAHRLEDFWTEAQHFDPERFSPQRAEDKRHSHCFFPFGGGAHMCLGMHFAYLQVKAFVHQFLQRYRVSLVPGEREVFQPIPIPKPKGGLPLRLERLD